jgi:type I restriction enzyme S subunit
MIEWKDYKLGDVLVIKNGKSRPKSDGNIAIYGGNGILGYSNEYNVEKETLIIGRVGAYCGAIYFENNQIWVSDNALYAKPKKDDDIKYLYYHLKLENLNKYAEGSSHPLLTQGRLNNLDITIPDLQTQSAIAEILSSLDDKIVLNNKINQELETLAQTLFKQWFIDFEFPNENGEPYKSNGGEMVDSELGEIPKGWTTEVLSEATKLIRGISYRKPELVLKDEGIAFVNLKCFSINGTFRQDGIKYYNGKYKNEQILRNNDILVAVTDLTQDREIIGMPILWNGITTALPSLDTCIIRSETLELKNFLYYEFKTKRYKSRIIEHANGSTVLHLSVKGLETYVFPLPSESLLKNWSEIIQPILGIINSNINEIIELSKTRDTLLPKLISGELEINEIKN